MGVQIPKDEGLSFLPLWGKLQCMCIIDVALLPIRCSIVVILWQCSYSLTAHFVLGSAKMQKLIISRWKSGVREVKSVLARARKVTVCLDGWSKTNLSASFLGISVCFYDPVSTKVRHVVLQLSELEHPHTGEVLAEHLERCMAEWDLNSRNILMVVSDNGSNMTKAVRLLNDWHVLGCNVSLSLSLLIKVTDVGENNRITSSINLVFIPPSWLIRPQVLQLVLDWK